jgi:hypothetical protein
MNEACRHHYLPWFECLCPCITVAVGATETLQLAHRTVSLQHIVVRLITRQGRVRSKVESELDAMVGCLAPPNST